MEKGSEDSGPPQPVGFWDPRLKHVRLEAMRKWVYTTVVLMAFILSVLSIYWAVFFHLPANLSSLVIYIVDFDGQVAPYDNIGHTPIVGPALVQLGQQMVSQGDTLAFGSLPPSDFNNDPLQVRQAVYDERAWGAIIINPNATALLYQAVETGNSSYDPMGACQWVYEDSRDDTNYYDFILPIVNMYLQQAVAMVGEQWASIALENATDPTALANLRAAPQAISPAIGFSEYNLRPLYPYTTIPAVNTTDLIILSFFSFSFYLPIHMKYLKPEGHPPLKFWQLIIWRWSATIVAYLFLSLAYSLISLAFQINFFGPSNIPDVIPSQISHGNTPAYGHGTFPVYWMINYVGMMALGLACENVAMLVGQPWTGLWLIFWVITNVSTAFYDIDIEPHFYYWGYAWPLHHVVMGSRTILFDIKSEIGLNFGVLFAWVAVNTALFPLACYWMRYKNNHGLHEYWA
ncbi:MNNG and nitrosoguanidine resistance protein [Saccharata proteae CBS 121410]|uniref:MNNG and nitrosoguanidine resistance protein n=1 Tax=Saccharata proteae CBS 121410 TaxID=1314787 RepID=A0A9P4LRV8_9PEZI|nr:MNNG and nitrosoguanidine resistance protein [Saccharata proteae CBS 121410]